MQRNIYESKQIKKKFFIEMLIFVIRPSIQSKQKILTIFSYLLMNILEYEMNFNILNRDQHKESR